MCGPDLVTPNPNLKLLDRIGEVLRLNHYSIRTETAHGDRVRRQVKFHRMRSREGLPELLFVASAGCVLGVFRDSLFLRKAAVSEEQPRVEGAPA